MKKLRILFAGYLPPHHGGSATVHAMTLKLLAGRGHSIRAISPITPAGAAVHDWFSAANPSLHIRRFEVPFFISATVWNHPVELKAQQAAFRSLICSECAVRAPDVLLLGDNVVTVVGASPGPPGIPNAMFVHGGSLYRLRRRLGSEDELSDLFDHYNRADHLIAVAAHQIPYLDKLGLTRHSVILNTIDTQEFAPREKSAALLESLGIAMDDIVIAHFSNLRWIKRPLDFVEAAGIALARNPRLLFVFGGDGELREAMEARCAQLGIAARVRFPGWIRIDRMPEYYSICDAVVMPSESEARAMVYLETQASGRVLIASDIPASREAVQDGVTGLLFPFGSPESLAERLLTMAANPSLRQAIGRQARAAAEKHSLDAYGASFEQTLLELAARSTARGAASDAARNIDSLAHGSS